MSESEPLPGPWIVDEPNAGLSIYACRPEELKASALKRH